MAGGFDGAAWARLVLRGVEKAREKHGLTATPRDKLSIEDLTPTVRQAMLEAALKSLNESAPGRERVAAVHAAAGALKATPPPEFTPTTGDVVVQVIDAATDDEDTPDAVAPAEAPTQTH